MRYRLRTLLIVLALFPLFIGMVGGILLLGSLVAEARERARHPPRSNHLTIGVPAKGVPQNH